MVENIGLGEAIAGGTRLSGEFGSPISKGLQLGSQNEWKQLEKQQAQAAKLQKKAEEMAKYSTFDNTKWKNPEIANKVYPYLNERAAVIQSAVASGDRFKAAEERTKTLQELDNFRREDNNIYALKNLPKESITRDRISELYTKGGVEAIAEYNRLAPVPIAEITEYGEVLPKIVPKPNVTKAINTAIEKIILPLPKNKRVGDNILIDQSSPDYKLAKRNAIETVLSDENLVNGILYTKDFEKHFTDYLKKNGLTLENYTREPQEDEMGRIIPSDLDKALTSYVQDRFDKVETNYAKYAPPRVGKGGGGTSNSRWFVGGNNSEKISYGSPDEAGYAPMTRFNSTALYTPLYKGFLVGEDGKAGKIESGFKLQEPRAKYLPSENVFEVKGLMSIGNDNYTEVTIRVSKAEFVSKTKLTEEGLAANIPNYKPKKAGGAKLSFPAWKAQNPNGTPSQYKEYKNK